MNFDEKTVERIKKLEREVERLRVKESPGAWLDWTPTITWEGGTTDPTTVSIGYARYTKIGKLVTIVLRVNIDAIGSGNRTLMRATLPTTLAYPSVCSARGNVVSSTFGSYDAATSSTGTTVLVVFPSAITRNGYTYMTGTYEVA